MPGCVVFARTREEVVGVLQLANRTRAAVVTRGSGTGLSGGSLPSPDCIVLCLAKMDRIVELDRANLTLLAEAGATTQAIADATSAAGLSKPWLSVAYTSNTCGPLLTDGKTTPLVHTE